MSFNRDGIRSKKANGNVPKVYLGRVFEFKQGYFVVSYDVHDIHSCIFLTQAFLLVAKVCP